MTGVLGGCLRAGSFEQGLAEPRAGSGVATAGLQYLQRWRDAPVSGGSPAMSKSTLPSARLSRADVQRLRAQIVLRAGD